VKFLAPQKGRSETQMHSIPSYTVERDIAAALRDWLFETALEHHGEGNSAESLADLAAMIDRELEKETDAIELGVTARTDPASSDDQPGLDAQHHESACQLETDHGAPPRGRVSVHYRTPFECTICGDVRTVATDLRVCAFVDACPSCGAMARFTAAGSPTPYKT